MPSTPTKVRNAYYKQLREFTEWHPWGIRPPHTKHNLEYIPITGAFVKQFDYNAALKRLIDHGWRKGAAPTTAPRQFAGMIGGQRGAAPPVPARREVSPLRQGFGQYLVANFDHMTLFEQVAAYTFRGDQRSPETIKNSGGFQPPSSRTDDAYIAAMAREFLGYLKRRHGFTIDASAEAGWLTDMAAFIRAPQTAADKRLIAEFGFWRKVMQQGEMHLQAMTDDSFMKGYISTTRDFDVAFMGAFGTLGGAKGVQSSGGGWLYVLRARSGFLLKKDVGRVTKEEGEVAVLGAIPWEDVMGFTEVSCSGPQPIYLRNMFDQQDYTAFKQVLGTLSCRHPRD